MTDPAIEDFQNRDRDRVLDVLAEAYLTDPWTGAWFGGAGPDQLPLNRAFFSMVLSDAPTGTHVVTVDDGAVVAFARWQPSPACQPSLEQARAFRAAALASLGGEVLSRMAPFLSLFRKREPDAPHIHFGPFAVQPTLQGRGFGRILLERYCEELDRTGTAGWLETSTSTNVRLYSRSGFKVVSEDDIQGVPIWFMAREGRGSAG